MRQLGSLVRRCASPRPGARTLRWSRPDAPAGRRPWRSGGVRRSWSAVRRYRRRSSSVIRRVRVLGMDRTAVRARPRWPARQMRRRRAAPAHLPACETGTTAGTAASRESEKRVLPRGRCATSCPPILGADATAVRDVRWDRRGRFSCNRETFGRHRKQENDRARYSKPRGFGLRLPRAAPPGGEKVVGRRTECDWRARWSGAGLDPLDHGIG